jgi:ATP-dependent helicase HrpB
MPVKNLYVSKCRPSTKLSMTAILNSNTRFNFTLILSLIFSEPLIQEPGLPIYEVIPAIKDALRVNNTLILQAPPGAGKSTIIPIELINEDWLKGQKILMLEPRRLAARSVAARMASLLNEETGDSVGYRVRFDNKISAKTNIEVLTEGILTRMLQQDNALEGIGMVVFDEFHERSLHADLALALCREAQQVLRDDLRILIMSATLDGEKLSALLDDAKVITSSGRQYPISIRYLPQEEHLPIHIQAAKAIKKAIGQENGDVLAFLPGAGEITRTADLLRQDLPGIVVYPLYGDLSPKEQQAAIMPDLQKRRKIVLATSIAETSLTIEGIKIVVDCGYSRVSRFDPASGLTKLETVRVTKDSADQRAGRAGRLGPGIAYRLWSEGANHNLTPSRKPEILEADLAPLVLELAAFGVDDVKSLAWLTQPPAGALGQAKELLQQLQAIMGNIITARGREMLRLPTHPRIAHMLLEGGDDIESLSLATDIAALIEERDILGKDEGADLSLRVEMLRKWRDKQYVKAERGILERIERLAANWRWLFRIQENNSMPAETEVGRLIAAAYPERIAKKAEQEGRYRLANGRMARLPQHDALVKEEWLAIARMDAGGNEGKIFLAAPLSPADVIHLATAKNNISWDARHGVLVARQEMRIGDIIAESKALAHIPEEERIQVISNAIKSIEFDNLPWSETIEAWQARILSLRKWRPGEEWPDVSKDALKESVSAWLGPYLITVRKREDIKKLDMYNILQNLMTWPMQQSLNGLAPQSISVPSGSEIKLQYFADASLPVLAVRLQEMFGLLDTPAINEGRTTVLLHLLSPGYKPVQVTQDLRSFWQNTYPDVRKQFRMRYPRHSWPEDPWTAEAVKGARRKGS